MGFLRDNRAQSIQIGAVLLFAVLIILIATWQAFVIPNQNERIEFNHNEEVQQQMTELRTTVNSMPEAATTRSATVDLGMRYPPRTIFRNPPPSAGTLETVGTTDSRYNVSIENATATTDEVDDFWNGSIRRYDTGAIEYRPRYSEYGNAPRTIYEHSLLYNRFDREGQELSVTGQTLVRDDRITIVALNGTFSENRVESTSVDLDPTSTRTRTVEVGNESHNVTISAPTGMDEGEWKAAFEEEMVDNGGHVLNVSTSELAAYDERSMLEVTLENGTYSLQMAKVGVGTRVSGTEAEYLTDVSGNGTTVQEDQTQRLELEVRDGYNKPMSGVTVNGTAEDGSFTDSSTKTTDSKGRVAFDYEPASATPAQKRINFTIDSGYVPDDSHLPGSPTNVTMSVEVDSDSVSEGPGGPSNSSYSVDWLSPTNDNLNNILSDCSETDCTWDVEADNDNVLTLRALATSSFERDGTTPTIDGADIDFAVDNSTVGTISPGSATTDASGEATTDLTANENGTVGIYAAGGGTSDVINVTVENVTTEDGTTQVLEYQTLNKGDGGVVYFDVENTADEQVTVTGFSVDATTFANNPRLNNGDSPEVEISPDSGQNGDANTDKRYDADGETNYELDQNALIDAGSRSEVDIRILEAQNKDTLSFDLEQVESKADADLTVTLELDGYPDQEYYFRDVS